MRRPAGWALVVGEDEVDDAHDNVTPAAVENASVEPGARAPLGAVE